MWCINGLAIAVKEGAALPLGGQLEFELAIVDRVNPDIRVSVQRGEGQGDSSKQIETTKVLQQGSGM